MNCYHQEGSKRPHHDEHPGNPPARQRYDPGDSGYLFVQVKDLQGVVVLMIVGGLVRTSSMVMVLSGQGKLLLRVQRGLLGSWWKGMDLQRQRLVSLFLSVLLYTHGLQRPVFLCCPPPSCVPDVLLT